MNSLTLCLNHSVGHEKQCFPLAWKKERKKTGWWKGVVVGRGGGGGGIHTLNNDSLRNWMEVYYSFILHKSIKQMPFSLPPAPTCQSPTVQSQTCRRGHLFIGDNKLFPLFLLLIIIIILNIIITHWFLQSNQHVWYPIIHQAHWINLRVLFFSSLRRREVLAAIKKKRKQTI